MTTEQQGQQANGEANGQEQDQQQGQQQAPTSSSEGNGEQQQANPGADSPKEPIKLPDDHPLIVKHNELKAKVSQANSELQELRAKSAQITKLEEELNARPTKEALETLQTRYDRLEAFLIAAGGPLGKALDSRSFTRDLFETDKDIQDLVKQWQRANPTATSQALGSTGGGEAAEKHDPNKLIRIAAGKA